MLTKAFFAGVCGQYGEKNNVGQDTIGRLGAEMLNLNTLLHRSEFDIALGSQQL